MGRLHRSDRAGGQGETRTALACVLPYPCRRLVSVGLLVLGGCSGLNQDLGNDPLVGGPPLRPRAAAPSSVPAPAALAPPPAANSILSPAALAAAAPRPADNGHDLRIGSSGGAGSDGWERGGLAGKTESGVRPTADGNGAVLRPPEPVTESAPRRELATVSNPVSAREDRGMTFEQARDAIAARGALWQRLETTGEKGEWKFSCSLPNRQNPRLRRTYEASANDPVAAIRAVLEQIDKEQ